MKTLSFLYFSNTVTHGLLAVTQAPTQDRPFVTKSNILLQDRLVIATGTEREKSL